MLYKKRKKVLNRVIIIVILALGLNFYLAQTFTAIAPGITVDLKDIVAVENGSKDKDGSFFLTTVSSRPLNLPFLVYAGINPHVDIEKKGQLIPPGWDMDQYMEYMKNWMEESKKVAEVVALKKAGYEPQIHGDGVKVEEIMPDSPAKGVLIPGDIIISVDKSSINLAEDVVRKVSKRNVGENVEFEVKRNDEIITVNIPTIESSTEKGKSAVGIYITTLNWKPLLPLKVDIDTGNIGGPSAGSMFAMEILNQVTDRDLTGGRKIAGTGTINLEEEIGEIGSVKQKVVAAARDGAEIFFTPEQNFQDAIIAAKGLGIEIVSVNRLDDILDYLDKLK